MSLEDTTIDKFTTLITAGFGLVAALAWNEAIKAFLAKYGLNINGPWVYAVVITVVAVLVTYILGKISERAKRLDLDVRLKNGAKRIIRRKKLKKEQ